MEPTKGEVWEVRDPYGVLKPVVMLLLHQSETIDSLWHGLDLNTGHLTHALRNTGFETWTRIC